MLGGLYPLKHWGTSRVIGQQISLDGVTTTGDYVINSEERGWCHLQVYAESDGTTILQIQTSMDGSVRKERTYNNNAWTSWRDIALDIPDFYKDYGTILAFAGGLVTYGALNIDTFTGLFASTKNMAAEWSPAASLPGVNQTTYAILLNIGCCQMAYVFDDMALYARPNFGSGFGAWSKVN